MIQNFISSQNYANIKVLAENKNLFSAKTNKIQQFWLKIKIISSQNLLKNRLLAENKLSEG
jgi:hypothetical protein